MVETFRIKQMRQEVISQRQIELIIGSLLGDAYLVKTTKGFAFRVNHGLKQKEYVDWKFTILENLVNSPPNSSVNCYYFRTVSHPYFEYLRYKFYPEGKKILPLDLVEQNFTPFAVAVWIMDDGTKCGNQLRINSHSFP
jgi:recombination protein RecA